jgi:hypothetical protein
MGLGVRVRDLLDFDLFLKRKTVDRVHGLCGKLMGLGVRVRDLLDFDLFLKRKTVDRVHGL